MDIIKHFDAMRYTDDEIEKIDAQEQAEREDEIETMIIKFFDARITKNEFIENMTRLDAKTDALRIVKQNENRLGEMITGENLL